VISALVAVATFIVMAALGAVIGAEFLGWLPALTRTLVSLSVRQLPAKSRERYREEFLYDINSMASDRKVTALLWALRTCISARGLAKSLNESENRRHEPKTTERERLDSSGSPTQLAMRHRPDIDLAALLKRLREERDITQEELALDAGITVAALSRIERGLNSPGWVTVVRISKALGVSLVELTTQLTDS
jgi:DNA-binding XRE family transcriptional regulator